MGRRFFGIILGVAMSLSGVGPSASDWLEPRSLSECNMHNPAYPFRSQLDAIKSAAQNCIEANSEPGWVSACGYLGPKTCLPIFRQACPIQNEMTRLYEQCRDRFFAKRIQEAAEKRRKEDQERAKEASGSTLENASVFGHEVPQSLSISIRNSFGVTNGAWPLSDALSTGIKDGIAGIFKRLIREFAEDMDQVNLDQPGSRRSYNASLPRKSLSQLNQNIALVEENVQRVGLRQNKLPFGEHSIVGGAYASFVTQIVEAQANGELDTPLAAIGLAVATWVAWEAGQAERELERSRDERLDAAASALLPQQQRVSRAAWDAIDLQRRADLLERSAQARRVPNPSLEVLDETAPTQQKPQSKSQKSTRRCVEVYIDGDYRFRNSCNVGVHVRYKQPRGLCTKFHSDDEFSKRTVCEGFVRPNDEIAFAPTSIKFGKLWYHQCQEPGSSSGEYTTYVSCDDQERCSCKKYVNGYRQ